MQNTKRYQCTPQEGPISDKDLRLPSSSFLDSHNFVARLAEELQKYNKKNDNKRSKCFFLGLIAASVGLLVLTAAAVAVTIEHSYHQKVGPGDVLINSKDGKPLRVQQHYVSIPLYDIQNIPLDQIEKVATITLQWAADEYGGARQYYYTVESVFRDVDEGITEVRLSSNHRLVANDGTATLQDSSGKILGVFDFDKSKKLEATHTAVPSENEEDDEGPAPDLIRSDDDESEDANIVGLFDDELDVAEDEMDAASRQLGKKKKIDKGGAEPGPGGEAGYCMYGCGRLAVTYPYYYRPFFGYGYPLVGTAGQFPAGYGGNPVTELAANGVLGPNNAAGLPVNNLGRG